MVTARREGDRPKKVRVLVAVEPFSLYRAMELILGAGSEIQVLTRPGDAASLQRHAKRLQPDLLITNARLLGGQACDVLLSLKRICPNSKIILTDFDARLASLARQCGADVYLEEDLLVRRLLATVRQLAAQRRTVGGVRSQSVRRAKRTLRARRLSRRAD